MKSIKVERQFANPWSAERGKHQFHTFRISGKNSEREILAMHISQSATGLSYQPRSWAQQALEQMHKTRKKYALLVRARLDYRKEVYRVDADGMVLMIATDVSYYRAQRICNYYYDRRHLYPADLFNNYCHGGYTTRIGLDRLVNNEAVNKKCGKIALSHLEIDMDGEEGHNLRVAYRN